MQILAINPGSTSTKIAIFEDKKEIFSKTIRHQVEELKPYNNIIEQHEFRKNIILDEMKKQDISPASLNAVVGRGGLVKSIPSGVYRVNERMLDFLRACKKGEHASNLGAILAKEIVKETGKEIDAYIVDPVVVDEMEPLARISGMPGNDRKSIFHALNQKAVARRYCRENEKKYHEVNIIVVHMGGGVSVGAHKKGKVIDVNNALDGDGPFSPERSGGVPVGHLAKMCFSGDYKLSDIKKKIKGNGGLVAYLGTNDGREVEERVQKGDKEAELVYKTMAYQISKEIGALAAVLRGNVDSIILTGGLAYDKNFISWIKERVSFVADITVYPGEDEMKALAENVFYALKGELPIKEYE